MVGRASLIVILGFSVIFGVASQYWNRTSNRAVENFVSYYDSSTAHNIAVSAADLACDSIFQNNADTNMASNSPLTGGFPGGGGYKIMTKGVGGNVWITALGIDTTLRGHIIMDTVKALLSPFQFSRYAFFTNSDNGVYWVTGDTLTGPYQTNGTMSISGVPVIKGPASAFNGTNPTPLPDKSGDTLKANSFQSGVKVALPSDINSTVAAAASVATFQPGSSYTSSSYAYDVFLTFNSDGTVTELDSTWQYTSGWGGGSWSLKTHTSATTVALTSLVNTNGQAVILVKNGNVHVQGTVDGYVTVVSQAGTGISKEDVQGNSGNPNGNILIDADITYKDDPRTTSSDDMLGLVANNSVMLATQPSSKADAHIDAAIFALNGGFSYDDYTGIKKGYLYIYGSVTQKTRGPVGQVGGNGYLKNYRYDSRFAYQSPPAFPGTNRYRVIAWRE